jgi:hypothetical protein
VHFRAGAFAPLELDAIATPQSGGKAKLRG